MVDWEAIVDRTRNLQALPNWSSPSDIISACANQYRIDKWERQQFRVECWIEKDALVGVIEGVCNELDIDYFSCRGYTSQSEMWAAAMRLRNYKKHAQIPIILHLGDHDPSGIDMSRDIEARLSEFSGDPIEVRRLALNIDQVREYNPPPNPAKITDSRSDRYIEQHGSESWELDALEPAVIAALIRDAVSELRDDKLWKESVASETKQKEQLASVSKQWDAVVKSVSK